MTPRLVAMMMVLAVLVAGEGATRPAHAADACVAAHIDAQRLRKSGKWKSAREKLLACGAQTCPDLLRQDCAGWLAEVERDLPSVIVSARDGGGRDLVDVRVIIDDELVLVRLDGKPIALDPGVHKVRLERSGSPPVEREIVVQSGEKNRAVSATFGDGQKPPMPARRLDTVAWTLGGVGLVALGSFTFFAITGERQYRDLSSSCSPRCNPSDVQSVRTRFVIADVSLGVGLVSLGVATAMLLTASPRSDERARVDLVPLAGGALASLSARF